MTTIVGQYPHVAVPLTAKGRIAFVPPLLLAIRLVVQTSLSTSYIYSRLESGHKKVQEHLDRRLNKLDVYERDKSRLFANAT